MADKAAPAKSPDLTPLFFILLILIIAGLGSIRWCGPYYAYQDHPPSNRGGIYDPAPKSPDPDALPDYRYYTILVGSFGNRDRAAAVAAELREKRVNNFIVEVNGKWLVCVGRYMSYGRAEQMLEVLENHGVENARILRPVGRYK
jgi:hypothetical protein